LLEDLGTICLNTVECTIREGSYRFSKITRPTQLQQKALDLLGVSLIGSSGFCVETRSMLIVSSAK
ncbi:hypothetical protein, partial [Microcystis sp. M169S2]|uniref:hypothetical protein n=1 Tax=Microcystis sp. M169S2 TaxID=2771157 RepID=UPI00259017BD